MELFLTQKMVSLIINKILKLTKKWHGLKNLDLAKKVTTRKNYTWSDYKIWKKDVGYIKNKNKSLNVIAIDYGIKKNILRYFSEFNCSVDVVSCTTSAEEILELKPDGVFLSKWSWRPCGDK